jgi:hypothetical protein
VGSPGLSVFHFLKMRPSSAVVLRRSRSERLRRPQPPADEATREQLLAVITGFVAHHSQLFHTRAG